MFGKSIIEGKQNFKAYHFYAICLLLCFVFLTGCGGGGYSSGGGMSSGSVPAAPTGVVSTAGMAAGTISISWPSDPGAAYYNLYMASTSWTTWTSSLPDAMKHTSLSCCSFIHTGLKSGTLYYFALTAVNSYGESPQSVQVSAKAP